jgi:hypothetical protein
MSRESDFVRDIEAQTKSGAIKWENVSPAKYSEYIFQSPSAYQAFLARYSKGNKKYQLLLVHKKVPGHNTDFDVVEERHATELIVLLEGRLLSTFTDYDVDERELGALSATIDQENEDIKDLLS